MKLRVGSRGSVLAVKQSELIMAEIHRAAPDIELELVTFTTTGDRIQHTALDKVGGKGLFVKELDKALLEGQVDLTVHSLKDMPMEQDPRLPIVACSRRENPLDALVLRKDRTALPPDGVIGCAAKRRALQLKELYPGCTIKLVRGNVPTRLAKLDEGGYDALVLATAGLSRLGLEERISHTFSPEEMLPAAGQGIIAVQCRRGSGYPFLRAINDVRAAKAALAERAFVRRLGGGCSDPTAAYAVQKGVELQLTGLHVFNGVCHRMTITGSARHPKALGIALAERMIEVYR